MNLYIAEKPSLAETIAKHFKSYTKNDGCFILKNGDIITWCYGHMYENFEAKDYDKKYDSFWKMEELPIIPNDLKIKPKPDTKKQLNVIIKLIKKATTIVNCGDPDREGQLLVDEIISENKFKGEVKRAWLKDLSTKGLEKIFNNLENNDKYLPLSNSAKARSFLDWLVGINLTRVYTLHAKSRGHNILLSIGRVQTPTLNLIVERDKQIKNHVVQKFYEISGKFEFDGIEFRCKKDLKLNKDEKITEIEIVENEILRLNKINEFNVIEVVDKIKETKPPLLFNLSDLQAYCNKKHGLSAKEVLNIAQELYATHKITSYPRSDCNYLNENEFSSMCNVIKTIDNNNHLELLNLKDMPRCFDNKKVTAHTGIVPNGALPKKLTENQTIVYEIICNRFISQFTNNYKYSEKKIKLKNGNDIYSATGISILDLGFKQILEEPKTKDGNKTKLPDLNKNDSVRHINSIIESKKTSPPKHYNEGTLINTMSNISKSVGTKDEKSILNDVGGIGTEATRADIIETLKKREYIELKKKNITCTERASNFIEMIIDEVKSPLLTASWEMDLKKIELGLLAYFDFIEKQKLWIKNICETAIKSNIDILGGKKCTKCEKGYLTSVKGKKGYFIACTMYPECKR